MKIAICLYGQPRLYKQGYNIIREFINYNGEYNFDIFFHTWYDEKMIGQYYQCSPWRNIPQNELLIENNLIDNMIELYKPKKYLFESPKIFDMTDIKFTKIYNQSSEQLKTNANNTLSCIYSKYQISKILEEYVNQTNIRYDYVISIRFDFLNKLNFKIEEMQNNKINVMNVSPRLYIADNFIITNYNLFIQYSNAYVNLDKILKNNDYETYLNNIGCGYNFNSEVLVTVNLLIYYDDLYEIICQHNKIPNFI